MTYAITKIVDAIKADLLPVAAPLVSGDARRMFEFEIDGARYLLSCEGAIARRWVVRPCAADYVYQQAASAADLDACLEAFARVVLARRAGASS